jgi:cytochrome P450
MQDVPQQRPPVASWETDWDHLDPRWRDDPYPIWDELRQKCPIAHTGRFQGAYLPTTYAAVEAIARDTKNFSSRYVVVREERPDPPVSSPPITSDPPEHRLAKQLLLPPFTPDEIKKVEPKARATCNELIDKFIKAGRCDAAQQYTRHIPVRIIAQMLGVPESDGDLFIHWIHQVLEVGITDRAALMKAYGEMNRYFTGFVTARATDLGDDLISRLIMARKDGKPLPPDSVVGTLRLLLIAGIDTTWSAIGSSLWHLAKTPADRERLVAEPALVPSAIEEFLRAYAPVTMARLVVKDTVVAGCPMKAGNLVLLSFPAANRDPAAFPDADKVIIDRRENRHAAFGLGIHRCVGSNLARLEMTVAVEEWLKRIPEFRLDPAASVTWSEGTVRGPRQLPILFS